MTTVTDTHKYTLHVSGTLGENFLAHYCPAGTVLTIGKDTFILSNLRTDQAGMLGIVRSLHNFGCTLLKLKIDKELP